ncbi:unnamed protein product [Tenebrio molitor]|nr:unnamed protein product [Tenebrio molitor]
MFYSETQLFLNFLRILDRLEVGVFARAVKLDSYGTVPTSSRAEKSCFQVVPITKIKKNDIGCF